MNQLTTLFKLLSDETRLRIILLLFQEELCVCEISGILDIPQPTVSKGLSKLRDLSLVQDTRKEKFIYYKLKAEHTLLHSLMTDIMENLQSYPQLQQDQLGIASKWKYSDTATPMDKNALA